MKNNLLDGDFTSPVDCDVDGSDLAALIANSSLLDLATFAGNFEENVCPKFRSTHREGRFALPVI